MYLYISSIERHILTVNAFMHSAVHSGRRAVQRGGHNTHSTSYTPHVLPHSTSSPPPPPALPPSQPLAQSLLFSHEVGGEHDGPALLVLGEEIPGGPASVGVHP